MVKDGESYSHHNRKNIWACDTWTVINLHKKIRFFLKNTMVPKKIYLHVMLYKNWWIIFKKIGEKIPSIFISVDESSAYKTLDHLILKRKLKYLGFSFDSLEIMDSYLKDRMQTVFLNGFYSSTKKTGDYSCI